MMSRVVQAELMYDEAAAAEKLTRQGEKAYTEQSPVHPER